MSVEEFFIEQFNKCVWIEDKNEPSNIFMVYDKHHERKSKMNSILKNGKEIEFIKTDDTVILFYQNHKHGYLEYNYNKIWMVFKLKYGIKYHETNVLIKGILNDDTKLKVLEPIQNVKSVDSLFNGATKLKVLTPKLM